MSFASEPYTTGLGEIANQTGVHGLLHGLFPITASHGSDGYAESRYQDAKNSIS